MKLIPQFVPNYFPVANKCVNSLARMGANMNCNFVFFLLPFPKYRSPFAF